MRRNDTCSRIGFQSQYANLSGLLKTAHYDLKTINKNRDKMNKKFFETTILFKEMPNLVLEAKNVQISYVYESYAI